MPTLFPRPWRLLSLFFPSALRLLLLLSQFWQCLYAPRGKKKTLTFHIAARPAWSRKEQGGGRAQGRFCCTPYFPIPHAPQTQTRPLLFPLLTSFTLCAPASSWSFSSFSPRPASAPLGHATVSILISSYIVRLFVCWSSSVLYSFSDSSARSRVFRPFDTRLVRLFVSFLRQPSIPVQSRSHFIYSICLWDRPTLPFHSLGALIHDDSTRATPATVPRLAFCFLRIECSLATANSSNLHRPHRHKQVSQTAPATFPGRLCTSEVAGRCVTATPGRSGTTGFFSLVNKSPSS